jgi:hypothetical protein
VKIRPFLSTRFSFLFSSRQPENLFLTICDVLKQNRDDLGIITMKKFFVENGRGIEPVTGYGVQASNAKTCTLR